MGYLMVKNSICGNQRIGVYKLQRLQVSRTPNKAVELSEMPPTFGDSLTVFTGSLTKHFRKPMSTLATYFNPAGQAFECLSNKKPLNSPSGSPEV